MFPGGLKLSDVAFVMKLVAALIVLVTEPSIGVFAENRGSSPTTVTSSSTTVVASGGVGTRSFSWERISGDANITVNAPSSATTTFTWSGTPTVFGTSNTAVFRCTVTDSTGTAFVDVLVSFDVYSSLAP